MAAQAVHVGPVKRPRTLSLTHSLHLSPPQYPAVALLWHRHCSSLTCRLMMQSPWTQLEALQLARMSHADPVPVYPSAHRSQPRPS